MESENFRFLDHTADAQVECRGLTFEALLTSAARALYALALKEIRCEKSEERHVEVHGEDREEVLVNWLQELIFLMEAEHFVAAGFDFDVVARNRVFARVWGYVAKPEERAREVKAATYHRLQIQEDDQGLAARVIFDL